MKFPNLNIKLGKPKESKLFLSLVPALKEKRAQQFTTLALTFVTISFFALFAINPTLSTIADLQRQLSDNSFVNDQMQKKIANITSLQTQYTNISSQLDPVFAAVPKDPGLDSFVGQIHTLSTQNSLTLGRIQTFPIEMSLTTLKSSKFLAYAFTAEAQGTVENIYKFVSSVGNFNRLVTFDEVTINRTGVLDNTFRLSLRGKVYFKEDVQ